MSDSLSQCDEKPRKKNIRIKNKIKKTKAKVENLGVEDNINSGKGMIIS